MLPPLEADVLRIIWDKGEASVRDVWLELRFAGKRLAYTTVMTTMVRLFEKGFLSREKQGKGYIYHPRLSKPEMAKRIIRRWVSRLLHTFGEPAVAYLVETLSESDDDLWGEIEQAFQRVRRQRRRKKLRK